MPIGAGIIGIVVSVLFFFIALIFFNAIISNVIDCDTFTNNTSLQLACNSGVTFAIVAFTIAPIGILLDVFGVIPIFGGRFRLGA